MRLVEMKCPSCGSNIELNSDKKLAFCPYCGAKMFIDDEVKKIELSGHIEVSGLPTLDRLCANAETFIRFADYKNAERTIDEIYKNYPNDYRGYYLSLINKTCLKPSSLNSAKSVYGYQINSFFDSIPLIKEIYNLANQALLFAPSDKHQEIKDAAYSGLKPYKSVCDDTKDKIEKYFRLEGVYITHRDETKKIIAVLQGDLAVMNMKKKRYLGGTVVSLAAFVLGLFWATMNLAFVIFSLAGLISLIVFLIKYIIQGSKIMILNRQIDDLSRVLKNLKSANGHSDWPDYQGRPEMIQEALNLFYSNLNRYSQT